LHIDTQRGGRFQPGYGGVLENLTYRLQCVLYSGTLPFCKDISAPQENKLIREVTKKQKLCKPQETSGWDLQF
ncbi:hypothetical protein ACQP3D_29210, partial [Escherichia coli]